MLSSSASRSGCGRYGRPSSTASNTSTGIGSGTRAPAISPNTASHSRRASFRAAEPAGELFRLQLGGLDRVVELRLLAIDLGRELFRRGAVRLDPECVQLRDGGGVLRGRDDMPGELVDDLRRSLGRNEEPVPAL